MKMKLFFGSYKTIYFIRCSVAATPMEEKLVDHQDRNPSQSYPLLPPTPAETSNKSFTGSN
ncbi:hypothetical protein CUMW_014910 [Citrus unshiu]|nr:hypothetical protein CUMW_014910 [Citrus unshiu]